MSEERSIPAGYYQGRALAGSEQYGSSDTGTDQIAIDVTIPSLEMTFTTFLYFTDAAAPYAVEKLRACGWKGSDLAKLTGLDSNEITLQIKYEMYKGKEQMKVQIATKGGRVKLENQMDEKAKRAFAARMRGFVDGTAPKAAPKADGAQRQRAAPEPQYDPNAGFSDNSSEDKIPF